MPYSPMIETPAPKRVLMIAATLRVQLARPPLKPPVGITRLAAGNVSARLRRGIIGMNQRNDVPSNAIGSPLATHRSTRRGEHRDRARPCANTTRVRPNQVSKRPSM